MDREFESIQIQARNSQRKEEETLSEIKALRAPPEVIRDRQNSKHKRH